MPNSNIYVSGLVRVESDSLRLVDSDSPDFKIDIVDPRFIQLDVLREWPINPDIVCGLCVNIEWVLSTVRICRVNELSVRFPIEQTNGIACLWPPKGMQGRIDSA